MARLSSSLPKSDGNGLPAIGADLLSTPEKVHVVVALVDCKSITTDVDTGEAVPTARIRRIEAIRGGDAALMQRVLRRAYELRTGKVVLPFDLEADLARAFGEVLPGDHRLDAGGDPPAGEPGPAT